MQSSSLSSHLYNFLKEKKIYLIYLPLAVYWILIFILTTVPTDIMPQLFNMQDKIEHMSAYFGLTVLISLTLHFQDRNKNISKYALVITLILVLTYGAVDEIHQIFVPGRDADIFDWLADALGGLIGIFVIFIFIKNKRIE